MTVLLQMCVYIYCIRCANIYSSLSFQLLGRNAEGNCWIVW